MKVNKLNELIGESAHKGDLSNDDLVQIIELAGTYLNLKTISEYARHNKLSYNGTKRFRKCYTLFGVKFIADND